MVTGPQGCDWLEAGREVSNKTGIPLGLKKLPAPTSDGIRIGQRGMALVRPDGHVAWRMPGAGRSGQGTGRALTTLLHERVMERAVANGISIAFQRRGSGPPLLLMHGNEADHSMFDALAEYLAASVLR